MATKLENECLEKGHMLDDQIERTEISNKSQNSLELENNSQIFISEDSSESLSTNESMDCDLKENKLDCVCENLDSALDSESNESDTTTSTTDKRLTETIAYQQKILEQNVEKIKNFEIKLDQLEQLKQELSAKLEQVCT